MSLLRYTLAPMNALFYQLLDFLLMSAIILAAFVIWIRWACDFIRGANESRAPSPIERKPLNDQGTSPVSTTLPQHLR